MIFQKGFIVPIEEKLFDRGIQVLKDEFGLVVGDFHRENKLIHPCLVWLDEEKIARYRVHIYSGKLRNEDMDTFLFHYWGNNTTKREILERDPMKDALNRIYSMAKNPIDIKYSIFDKSIDEHLKEIAELDI